MLDGLLVEQIRGDDQIKGMLAVYNKKPAFFYQKAPLDTAKGWNGKEQYPRADYNVDMRYDPERKTAGTLTINVWCSTQSAAMPEDIEARLLTLINGTFYTEHGGDTVCAVWDRSDAFNFELYRKETGSTPEIFGITLTFDLLTFPRQMTTDPDPIEGLIRWTRRNFDALTIISSDEPPPVWKPTDTKPAVYWRFIGSADDRQSFSVTWYNGTFAAHIIAETVMERNRWIKALAERMQIDGEILLADGSPMFLKRLEIRHDADPLRDGQILITGQYGVLAGRVKMPARIPLNHAQPLKNMEVRYGKK